MVIVSVLFEIKEKEQSKSASVMVFSLKFPPNFSNPACCLIKFFSSFSILACIGGGRRALVPLCILKDDPIDGSDWEYASWACTSVPAFGPCVEPLQQPLEKVRRDPATNGQCKILDLPLGVSPLPCEARREACDGSPRPPTHFAARQTKKRRPRLGSLAPSTLSSRTVWRGPGGPDCFLRQCRQGSKQGEQVLHRAGARRLQRQLQGPSAYRT